MPPTHNNINKVECKLLFYSAKSRNRKNNNINKVECKYSC